MEPDPNSHFQRQARKNNLSGKEEARVIAATKTSWQRTKYLATILEIVLWISAIAFSFGIVNLYRMAP